MDIKYQKIKQLLHSSNPEDKEIGKELLLKEFNKLINLDHNTDLVSATDNGLEILLPSANSHWDGCIIEVLSTIRDLAIELWWIQWAEIRPSPDYTEAKVLPIKIIS